MQSVLDYMGEQINNNIAKEIGERIAIVRTAKKLTQQGLAVKIGVATPSISKIEAGLTDINLSRLEQIADALQVNLLSLFTNDNREIVKYATSGQRQFLEKKLENRNEELLILQRKVILLYDRLSKK